METIDLDLEETNELAFKLRVEGLSTGSVTARLYCESGNGHMHAFSGQFLGEPEIVTFCLSKMKNLVNEGVYPGWVEVVIDNRQFVPVKFNLKFKKPLTVQVESIQREISRKEEPVVSMRSPTVVKKISSLPSAKDEQHSYRSVNLKEWYRDNKHQNSLK